MPTNQSRYPEHPAVDWSTRRLRAGRPGKWEVQVTCQVCGTKRWSCAQSVARSIRRRSYNGKCPPCRRAGWSKHERPHHPAVDWSQTKLVLRPRSRRTHVLVTCPRCKEQRWMEANRVSHEVRTAQTGGLAWTGGCMKCVGALKKTALAEVSPGRSIQSDKGYVLLYRDAIDPADDELFTALCAKPNGHCQNRVLEHRFVVSKALGRPLRTDELVHHLDGVKTNNTLANLRVYARGNPETGGTHHKGYGTYYHEWQMALGEIARLRKQLAQRHLPL